MWQYILNVITLSVVMVLIFMLWILPARTKKRNIFFLLLLSALGIHLLCEQFLLLGFLHHYSYSVIVVSMVISFGPSLYFYTRKLYNLNTKNYIWHLTLSQLSHFLLVILNITAVYYTPQWLFSFNYAFILAVYFGATVLLVKRKTAKKHELWTKTIAIGFGALLILHIVEVVLININIENIQNAVKVSSVNTSIQNIFIIAFLLMAIKQILINPKHFSNAVIRIPYEHNDTTIDEQELNKIVTYVSQEKAFKYPDLNREKVAEETALNYNQISKIINSTYKKNFNDWINDFRVQEAKQLLLSSDMSIKEIYFEVGFNSKSAFYTAFKKKTHQTPSEFRASNKN